MKEAASASHIRLDASQHGFDLWRNNVGACQDIHGRLIRYGLCNESKKQNKQIKSSDLIGIRPVLITPEMIGQVLGVFMAVETKKSDWIFDNNDERAIAQKAFHDIVLKNGGFAGFARNVDDFRKIARL